jgi:hypothetical protein
MGNAVPTIGDAFGLEACWIGQRLGRLHDGPNGLTQVVVRHSIRRAPYVECLTAISKSSGCLHLYRLTWWVTDCWSRSIDAEGDRERIHLAV